MGFLERGHPQGLLVTIVSWIFVFLGGAEKPSSRFVNLESGLCVLLVGFLGSSSFELRKKC